MDKPEFNLECSINNLYHISLQYYTLLKQKDHPMKKNITDIMDLLIAFRKSEKERTLEENTRLYDEIHSLAYKNIEEIYKYDEKIDQENGIDTTPKDLTLGYKDKSSTDETLDNKVTNLNGNYETEIIDDHKTS
jgi:hypothetical protein